jgi:hypothetical protein
MSAAPEERLEERASGSAAEGGAIAALAGTFRTTMAALGAPRRFVAILVVIVPLLALQVNYSSDAFALPIAVMMCLAFVLVAPTLWRHFFPLAGGRRPAIYALLYGVIGATLVVGIGRGIPWLLGMGYTFLTTRPSLLVSCALFWVGGWGLARDIDLEENYKRERERAEALRREAENAQLLALKSHLDPHFLFNTLNAIAEWCRADGVVAERAILELSSMLRTVMAGIRVTSWSLEKEVELCDTVMDLHKIRDPNLFTYERDVPDPLPAIEVPPMLLLPVAENAMKHGPCAGHRGTVRLCVRETPDAFVLSVKNPGGYKGPREGGQGLEIVQKRLRLSFGARARFTMRGEGDATLAEIVIDKEKTS